MWHCFMLAIAVTICSVDSSFAPGQAVTGALGANGQAKITPASTDLTCGLRRPESSNLERSAARQNACWLEISPLAASSIQRT